MLICFPANLISNPISKASLARITVALLAYEAKSIISIITAFAFLFDLAAVENNIWKLFEHFFFPHKKKAKIMFRRIFPLSAEQHSSTCQTLDVCRPEGGEGGFSCRDFCLTTVKFCSVNKEVHNCFVLNIVFSRVFESNGPVFACNLLSCPSF